MTRTPAQVLAVALSSILVPLVGMVALVLDLWRHRMDPTRTRMRLVLVGAIIIGLVVSVQLRSYMASRQTTDRAVASLSVKPKSPSKSLETGGKRGIDALAGFLPGMGGNQEIRDALAYDPAGHVPPREPYLDPYAWSSMDVARAFPLRYDVCRAGWKSRQTRMWWDALESTLYEYERQGVPMREMPYHLSCLLYIAAPHRAIAKRVLESITYSQHTASALGIRIAKDALEGQDMTFVSPELARELLERQPPEASVPVRAVLAALAGDQMRARELALQAPTYQRMQLRSWIETRANAKGGSHGLDS